MVKTRSASKCFVPIAFGAMGVLAFIFAGCERHEAPSAQAPESYMKDPVFRSALKEKRVERNSLAKVRDTLVEKMTAMIEAKKAELKTDDLEKVKAELEKDLEWKSLYQRCLDVNQAIEDNQKKTMGIVKRRLAPNGRTDGKISK